MSDKKVISSVILILAMLLSISAMPMGSTAKASNGKIQYNNNDVEVKR